MLFSTKQGSCLGAPNNRDLDIFGSLWAGPDNKEYCILGSLLRSPLFMETTT